jgi:hypothetical protein
MERTRKCPRCGQARSWKADGERGNVQRVGMTGVPIGYPLEIRHSDLGSIGKNTSRSKGLR